MNTQQVGYGCTGNRVSKLEALEKITVFNHSLDTDVPQDDLVVSIKLQNKILKNIFKIAQLHRTQYGRSPTNQVREQL